jgi:hypothetical protein
MACKRKYEPVEDPEYPESKNFPNWVDDSENSIEPLIISFRGDRDGRGIIHRGKVTGYLVRRSAIPKPHFARYMQSQKPLGDMASALFDRYGRWESKFKDKDEPAYGAGVWNN